MYRAFVFILMVMTCLLPFTAAASDGTVPKAAMQITRALDSQVARQMRSPADRSDVSLAVTVPVALDNLNQSSPLARQMAEEITRCFMEAGYRVAEIRKGSEIVMDAYGERLLTRDVAQLSRRDVRASTVLVGTYTVTRDSVRFNVKLLHSSTNEVLAMASATVPVTSEVFPLLAESIGRTPAPSVYTRLR